MISIQCLALFARLRWPDLLTSVSEKVLSARFQEIALAFHEHILEEDQALRLFFAADVILFAAFLQEREPNFPHYSGTLTSMQTAGIAQGQVEAAAYVKVLALMQHRDPHAEITRLVVHVPAIVRKIPGRRKASVPLPENSGSEVKHLHLNTQLLALVQEQTGNLTRTTEEALLLWLVLGSDRGTLTTAQTEEHEEGS